MEKLFKSPWFWAAAVGILVGYFIWHHASTTTTTATNPATPTT